MRSDLVFGAMTHVSDRFLLARILAKATREFHRPGTRIQDTTNEVLARSGRASPIAVEHANRVSPIVSLHRSSPKPAIPLRAKDLIVPAIQQAPQALSEALWVLGA
jgi:hypothetical protein